MKREWGSHRELNLRGARWQQNISKYAYDYPYTSVWHCVMGCFLCRQASLSTLSSPLGLQWYLNCLPSPIPAPTRPWPPTLAAAPR